MKTFYWVKVALAGIGLVILFSSFAVDDPGSTLMILFTLLIAIALHIVPQDKGDVVGVKSPMVSDQSIKRPSFQPQQPHTPQPTQPVHQPPPFIPQFQEQPDVPPQPPKTVPVPKNPQVCKFCGKTMSSEYQLKIHIVTKHPERLDMG